MRARDGSYQAYWAFDDAEERVAFEAVVDRIIDTWEAHPGMHIYHFNHYEPTAFKRLMGRYVTRAEGLDRLLRAERFVDLYTVARQAVRAGVESYSIKQLEQFYGFTREVKLRDVSAHLQAVELALEGGALSAITGDVRSAVQGYNRDDCHSTEALRDWLERLRAEAIAGGATIERPTPQNDASREAIGELEQRQRALRDRLLASIPAAAGAPEHAEHPNWLLAYLIDWHRREDKSEWWEFYRLRDLADEELFEESQAIAGLEHVARLQIEHFKNGKIKSVIDRYRFPLQETEIHRGSRLRVPGGKPIGDAVDLDRAGCAVDIQKGRNTAEVHPTAVYQSEVIGTDVQQKALFRFAEAAVDESSGTDLLLRRKPRLTSGDFRPRNGETPSSFAVRIANELDRTTLPVQGPPGAGKTYVGAQMIRALVDAGKKVGVTAVSHKVIRNLLDAVHQQNPLIALGHRCKGSDEEDVTPPHIREFGNNESALEALSAGEVQVLGGTSWLWAHEDAAQTVDILFVDEAGQMSLANALAVSAAARSLVLLGDPQQLEQPQKGTHPDGVGVSALEHVLEGAATMPFARGLFLPTTWRLHQPSVPSRRKCFTRISSSRERASTVSD